MVNMPFFMSMLNNLKCLGEMIFFISVSCNFAAENGSDIYLTTIRNQNCKILYIINLFKIVHV